jgi:hypothetical protein
MRQHIVVITLILLFCASASAADKPWKKGTVTIVVDVDPPNNRAQAYFFSSHSYEIGNGTDTYCSRGDEYHAPDCTAPPAPHDETSYDITSATVVIEDGTISFDPFPRFYSEMSYLAIFVEEWEATRERLASGWKRGRKDDVERLPPPEQRSNAFPPCASGPCSFEYKGAFLYQLGKRHKDGIQDVTIELSDELGTQRIHANYKVP